MNFKRIFRGPYLYVLIALAGIFIGWSVISQGSTQQIDTQKGLEQLSDGKVSSAIVNSTEQRVDLTLRRTATSRSSSTTPRPAAKKWSQAVNDANLPKGYNDPSQQGELVPLARSDPAAVPDHRCPVLVPALERPGRRLEGHAVRQVEGEDQQQGEPAGLLRRRRRLPTRRSRNSTRSRSS